MKDADGTTISRLSGSALATRCRDLTPDLLAALSLRTRVVRWETDDRNAFDTE